MKTGIKTAFLAVVLLSLISVEVPIAHAQGTSFTYQGRLLNGGNPANGLYDFRFKLFQDAFGNNQVSGTLLTNGVFVTNGLFMAALDFGAGIFNGSNYWLGVGVRTNGGGSYTDLSPLQPVTPAPYAIFANTASNVSGTVQSGNISGTYGNAVTLNNSANNFTGSFSGNGTNLTNVNAVTLGGVGAAGFWQTAGNAGTTAGANFLGTSDNQPLEIHVNNQRAMRLELPTPDQPNIIGGYSNNFVAPGISGATIAGGGLSGFTNRITGSGYGGFIGGGRSNTVNNFNGVVAGGANNAAFENATVIGGGSENYAGADHANIAGGQNNTNNGNHATIGGGLNNTNIGTFGVIAGGDNNYIGPNADRGTISGGGGNVLIGSDPYPVYSTIAGGANNLLQSNSIYSVISGGISNTIGGNAFTSVIAGGTNNFIQNSNAACTIGGGAQNTVHSNAFFAVVSGGLQNINGAFASSIGGGQGNNNSGGDGSVIAGGYFNTNGGSGAALGGGQNNFIGVLADHSAIAGGGNNTIVGSLALPVFGAIGGGQSNMVATNVAYGAIGGGLANTIQPNASFSSIGGGSQNTNSGIYATICGGSNNVASGIGAVVPGGISDYATGANSFAAGNNAVASHSGVFVWADGLNFFFDPFAQIGPQGVNNSFNVRSTGGFYVVTGVNASGTITAGAYLAPNATSWSVLSDRNAKKNFQPVDTKAVLEKLASIPIEQWNYKWEPDSATPNLGPMAQDFKAAFYPGRDEKTITTLEFDGVELAAIQGLNQKLDKLNGELKRRDSENAELKSRLEALERLVSKQRQP